MKLQLPWIGNASGTSGNMILQTYHGETYMREKPLIYHDPKTPAQMLQRYKFWGLLDEWRTYYDSFKAFIPESQRKKRNVFDELFSIMWFIVEKRYTQEWWQKIWWWGIDKDNEVTFNNIEDYIDFNSRNVLIEVHYENLVSKRKFTPKNYVLLAMKPDEQQYMIATGEYPHYSIQTGWPNAYGWQFGDNVLFFLALYDENFFTNFALNEQPWP